jgi:hypothetical protein
VYGGRHGHRGAARGMASGAGGRGGAASPTRSMLFACVEPTKRVQCKKNPPTNSWLCQSRLARSGFLMRRTSNTEHPTPGWRSASRASRPTGVRLGLQRMLHLGTNRSGASWSGAEASPWHFVVGCCPLLMSWRRAILSWSCPVWSTAPTILFLRGLRPHSPNLNARTTPVERSRPFPILPVWQDSSSPLE